MMVAIFAPKKESSVLMVYIGDANDPDTIRADAAIFFSTEFAATDADEVTALNKCFVGPLGPNLPAPLTPTWARHSGRTSRTSRD